MSKSKITVETLRQRLRYDPKTGEFTWLVSRYKSRVGTAAGTVWRLKTQTCRQILIGGVSYRAHILAWIYMTGEWPKSIVDHRDCDGLNNIWLNLRLATDGQSNANRRRARNNTTGFKGVSRMGTGFRAAIVANGESIYLGLFRTAEGAHAAYAAAAVKYFGEFARAA